jgi:hypothetical protein
MPKPLNTLVKCIFWRSEIFCIPEIVESPCRLARTKPKKPLATVRISVKKSPYKITYQMEKVDFNGYKTKNDK